MSVRHNTREDGALQDGNLRAFILKTRIEADMLDTDDVCELMGFSEDTLRIWKQAGLPYDDSLCADHRYSLTDLIEFRRNHPELSRRKPK